MILFYIFISTSGFPGSVCKSCGSKWGFIPLCMFFNDNLSYQLSMWWMIICLFCRFNLSIFRVSYTIIFNSVLLQSHTILNFKDKKHNFLFHPFHSSNLVKKIFFALSHHINRYVYYKLTWCWIRSDRVWIFHISSPILFLKKIISSKS